MRNRIKGGVCIILTICILMLSFPPAAFAASVPLKIAVAADTHFQCAANLGEPSDEYTEYMLEPELYGYASTQGQMHYESEAIVAEALSQFVRSDSEYLLIAGDLTCGKRESHRLFAEYLKKAEKESGKSIFVINGNHDCAAQSGESSISMEEFREIYAAFGYNEALQRHEDSASYTVDLNGQYRLIAIDSCIYGEDEGKISKALFQWIKEQTDQAKRDGKTLIAMMHHSLLPHYALQPMIDGWQYYASWFADHGIQTVLTGHIHANDISSSVSDRGNTIYDVQTGALISAPNTYRTMTFDTDGIVIRSHFISAIDTALLPAFLSDKQKTKLAEDFTGYAEAYFVSGVCKWLNRNIGSVNRIARWFNLKEGSKAYTAAEQIMRRLGAAVGQDIYDAGNGASIEAALAPYHISVPQSSYKKPYQVAAKLMYGFFHGDEDAAGNEADTKLLLLCLEGAILSAMQSGVDASSLGALTAALNTKNKIVGTVSALKISALMREAAENMALALLQTLTGGFVDDYSAPQDLFVTLTFHGGENTVPLHLISRFLRLIAAFWERLFF